MQVFITNVTTYTNDCGFNSATKMHYNEQDAHTFVESELAAFCNALQSYEIATQLDNFTEIYSLDGDCGIVTTIETFNI